MVMLNNALAICRADHSKDFKISPFGRNDRKNEMTMTAKLTVVKEKTFNHG